MSNFDAAEAQRTYSRKRASLGMFSSNQLSYSNPWVISAWSFFFPGFGHIMLGQYIQGWTLFIWEVFINTQANFNAAIMLALTGRFHQSVKVLESRGSYWILLYGVVFCYALYGSYNLAVEVNNLYGLAFEENTPIEVFKINALHFNFLNKANPWVGAAWSLLMPGLGQMYFRRISSAIFALTWWIVIARFSHLLPAVVYTFTGHFRVAVKTLNPEWLLYVPSIYGFAFYNSYVSIVELGKLYDKEQANFLKAKYQSAMFPFRLRQEDTQVRIISTFDHSVYLEKAIVSVEKQGIPTDKIYAVPINKNTEDNSLSIDTIHRADGKSFIDIPAILAALMCALGTIYGFVLHWGPVLWGLIGFAVGLTLGVIIKILTIKLSPKTPRRRQSKTEVVVMIDCDKELADKIERILWANKAFGVSKVGS